MEVLSLIPTHIGWTEQATIELFVDCLDGLGDTELFDQNTNWAKSIAFRIYRQYPVDSLEPDDYVNYALIGLLESVGRFDRMRNIPFQAFAAKRIKGEILNNISRYSEESCIRQYNRKLMQERLKSLQDLDNSNSLEHSVIATILDIAVGLVLESEDNYEGQVYPYQMDSLEYLTLSERIHVCCNKLPDKERKVLMLHYQEHLTFTEVSLELGLSLGRISQLHSKALKLLRKKLGA